MKVIDLQHLITFKNIHLDIILAYSSLQVSFVNTTWQYYSLVLTWVDETFISLWAAITPKEDRFGWSYSCSQEITHTHKTWRKRKKHIPSHFAFVSTSTFTFPFLTQCFDQIYVAQDISEKINITIYTYFLRLFRLPIPYIHIWMSDCVSFFSTNWHFNWSVLTLNVP